MPEELDYDDLTRRLTTSAAAVRARPDAPTVLAKAIAEHRRRSSWAVMTAAAAVIVVAVSGSVWATRDSGGSIPVSGAPRTDSPTGTPEASQPAYLFHSIVGGRSRGGEIRYHLVPGERMNAQFEWWPQVTSGPGPYLAGVSIENFKTTTDCADLVPGTSSCEGRSGGDQVARFEISGAAAFRDPIHRAAPITDTAEGSTIRGVTYFHADGLAVTAFVCDCSPRNNTLSPHPPLTEAELEQIAVDDLWIEGRFN